MQIMIGRLAAKKGVYCRPKCFLLKQHAEFMLSHSIIDFHQLLAKRQWWRRGPAVHVDYKINENQSGTGNTIMVEPE